MPIGRRPRAGGFAYVMLLIAIAVLAIVATGSLVFGATVGRRAAEQELLVIGAEFQRALQTYAGLPAGAAAPAGLRGPRALEDLVRDPRVPGIRRHLRQIHADPLTGRLEWGLIVDPQGFIVGIHSLAPGRPIKRTGFDATQTGFEAAESYGQWVFGARAVAVGPARSPSDGR